MCIRDRISDDPIAAASVAQVYSAKLKSGESVVIKVLRPKIEKIINADISLMHFFAQIVSLFVRDSKKLSLHEVINEFENSIINELDLLREAGSASQIRRSFIDSDMLYVPEVYWDLCSDKVLVMEQIFGVGIDNIEKLQQQNVDMKVLAERGVEIFFSQVFRDRFFHADMHPGNLFIDATVPDKPKYLSLIHI